MNQQNKMRQYALPAFVFMGSLIAASIIGLLTTLLYGLIVFVCGLIAMIAVLLPGAEHKDRQSRDQSHN
jgi:hypothetical protein